MGKSKIQRTSNDIDQSIDKIESLTNFIGYSKVEEVLYEAANVKTNETIGCEIKAGDEICVIIEPTSQTPTNEVVVRLQTTESGGSQQMIVSGINSAVNICAKATMDASFLRIWISGLVSIIKVSRRVETSGMLEEMAQSILEVKHTVGTLQTKDEVLSINTPGYIKASDGQIGSGGYNTGFIDISYFTNIQVSSRNLDSSCAVIALYDENKAYLQELSVKGTGQVYQEFSIDLTQSKYESAKYMIVSSWNSLDNAVILINGNTIVESFYSKKTFCALGDSITAGDGNNGISWYNKVLAHYGSTSSKDFSVSGQVLRTMANNISVDNMANVDVCFVMGGHNQVSNYRLGSIEDAPTPNEWKPKTSYNVGERVLGGTQQSSGTSVPAYLYWYECTTAGISGETPDASGFSTIDGEIVNDGTVVWKCVGNPSWYSDMKGVLKKIQECNPNTRIIWLTPPKAKNDSNVTDLQYVTRSEKVEAIRNFCEIYSVELVDIHRLLPITPWNKDAVLLDNLHPTDSGHNAICSIIISYLG